MANLEGRPTVARKPLRVLMIDDEQENLTALEVAIGTRWKITTLLGPEPLYNGDVDIMDFDVLFLDLVLHAPKGSVQLAPREGLVVLDWIRQRRDRFPVLVLTAVNDPTIEKLLKGFGSWVRYYEKPYPFAERGYAAMIEEFVDAVVVSRLTPA